MSYDGISIRDALDKINSPNSGWYLPQVQRQYVWGARDESETYICLLLDSLLRGYPIGGVVLWNTTAPVPYRKFIEDYVPGTHARLVDEGHWGAHKLLVYDGQQRLQTLFSVLRHRFNNRILHYDLLFDVEQSEPDDTGFFFLDRNAAAKPEYLRMNTLSARQNTESAEVLLEDTFLLAANDDPQKKLIVRRNLKALWKVFVATDHKAIAYFSVRSQTQKEVNEVFRRLNTGGIPLTNIELVLSDIKAVHHDYEERLWALAEKIEKRSGGIAFPSTSILQFFHLLIKKSTRIGESLSEKDDIAIFNGAIDEYAEPLVEIFENYLSDIFGINHASIVPRWLAVLPIAAYLCGLKVRNYDYRIRAMPDDNKRLIDQYFILSQLCDWNTQTMVNQFAAKVLSAARDNNPFPLEDLRNIATQKNRTGTLKESQILSQPWFSTKVLMPERRYVFHEKKPQIDHIFPKNLNGATDDYRAIVDVVWNFQPIPDGVNNYKRNQNPLTYFQSNEGRKYLSKYDFTPPLSDPVWQDAEKFVAQRREELLAGLKERYGLEITSD